MQSIKMYHHVNQNSLSIGYIQIQTQVVQKQVKPYRYNHQNTEAGS